MRLAFLVPNVFFALIPTATASADHRPGITQTGSLLAFPAVEVKWNRDGQAVQDTIISLVNDVDEPVNLRVCYVNGDGPIPGGGDCDAANPNCDPATIEPPHPGWNHVCFDLYLSNHQPVYFSALTGSPAATRTPFNSLDPSGRLDPEIPDGSRRVRGFILVWAVNTDGHEISWNHLSGKATTIHYGDGSVWEYSAYAFAALQGDNGSPTDSNPGLMLLNGIEYEAPFDRLIFNFFATGQASPSDTTRSLNIDTDLTLMPLEQDLREESFGPVTSAAVLDVWNLNETRFGPTEELVTCWFQRPLSLLDPASHIFLGSVLQTDNGKARIEGAAKLDCPDGLVVPSALLGVAARSVRFQLLKKDVSAVSLIGEGCEEAAVLFSPSSIEERTAGGGTRPGAIDDADGSTRPGQIGSGTGTGAN
ncbi:MAG: hypothetical protein ACE5GE_04065 [Phycisphaerae bacterium]